MSSTVKWYISREHWKTLNTISELNILFDWPVCEKIPFIFQVRISHHGENKSTVYL